MSDEYELEGREDGDVHVLNDPLPKLNIRFRIEHHRPSGRQSQFKLSVPTIFAIRSVYAEIALTPRASRKASRSFHL